MYGYDRIPSKELPGELPKNQDQKAFEFIDLLKKQLMHQGLSEIQTYSFYTTHTLNALGFDGNKQKFLVKLANPISKETQFLRMNLWPNLAESAAFNNKSFPDVAIFEIGKVYTPNIKGAFEKNTLAIALINATDNPTPELIKIISNTFKNVGFQVSFKDAKPLGEAKRLFHPLRFKSIVYKGNAIGGVAEIHPEVLDKYNSKNTISVAEIDLEKLHG
jgi:phenylalanyl-tRNA synthetase beta chain